MRAFIIASWVALLLSFLMYPLLFTMGMDYIVIGHGLMPELCFALAALWSILQFFLSAHIDELEDHYMPAL